MKFGQSSFVFFNYSLQDAIKSLGENGYDCIEIWGGRPHYYRQDLDEDIDEIKSLLEHYNMTVANFIPAQFRYPSILCSLNEKVRRDSVQYIRETIDSAILLGSPSVSICPGLSLKGEDVAIAWQALKKSITELLDYITDKKISILIEPAHQWETTLIYTIEDAVRMIHEVGAKEKLGICLDTGHMHINGESFEKAIGLAKDYPMHFHIDDNLADMDTHAIPGKGNIDFSSLNTILQKIDYQGCISAELGFQYTNDPEEAVRETRKILSSIFHQN